MSDMFSHASQNGDGLLTLSESTGLHTLCPHATAPGGQHLAMYVSNNQDGYSELCHLLVYLLRDLTLYTWGPVHNTCIN